MTTVLAIDVGNTNTKFALYLNGQASHTFQIPTSKEGLANELQLAFKSFANDKQNLSSSIEGVVVASVVPDVNQYLSSACQQNLGIKPRFVNQSDKSMDALAIPLKIKIDNPACLGADRIASSVGAIARYGKSLLIFNFGTATTCEVIGDDNDYLGGIIAPGITVSIKALHEHAALLPEYEFRVPSKVIPTSTEDALYGGIFYATIGLIEKMVQEVRFALPSHKFKVIATGWLAQVISKHTNVIDIYDHDLVTFGLYTIYLNNR